MGRGEGRTGNLGTPAMHNFMHAGSLVIYKDQEVDSLKHDINAWLISPKTHSGIPFFASCRLAEFRVSMEV